MDWNRIEGNWKQFTGKVKEQWGKLTDDDLTEINGKRDQLEGKISAALWLCEGPDPERGRRLVQAVALNERIRDVAAGVEPIPAAVFFRAARKEGASWRRGISRSGGHAKAIFPILQAG